MWNLLTSDHTMKPKVVSSVGLGAASGTRRWGVRTPTGADFPACGKKPPSLCSWWLGLCCQHGPGPVGNGPKNVAPDPVGCVVSLGPARWVTVPGTWHQFQAQEPGFGGFLGRGHLGLFLFVMPRGRSFPRPVEFFYEPSLPKETQFIRLH